LLNSAIDLGVKYGIFGELEIILDIAYPSVFAI